MKLSNSKSLSVLREQIRSIDEQMIKLMGERVDLARKVGEVKLENCLPIKDYQVEKEIIDKARGRARQLGIYEQLVEDVLKLQIKYSVYAQEEFHSRAQVIGGSGKKILIIGGLGKMGLWLAQFFSAFGHQVSIVDKQAAEATMAAQYRCSQNLESAIRDQDFIVLATPMSSTCNILRKLIALKPSGIIFDICSLKTPIMSEINAAQESGMSITSIHPMFGPNTDVLAGKNIVFCSSGDRGVTEQVRNLFESTTANLIDLPLEKHDTLMSVVLGLSHFVSLSFAKAIVDLKIPSQQLSQVASSTFRAQLNVTVPVINENQDLYYEIQSENKHTHETIGALIKSMQDYLDVITAKDRETFKSYMSASQDFLK